MRDGKEIWDAAKWAPRPEIRSATVMMVFALAILQGNNKEAVQQLQSLQTFTGELVATLADLVSLSPPHDTSG